MIPNPNVYSMSEEGKNRGIAIDNENPYYGTFQGVTNYYPHNQHPPSPSGVPYAYYQRQGYHSIPVYVAAEGRPVREYRLPCCGLGLGWFLFICGWFLGGVPWYFGTFILMFVQMDCREKPGLIACALASFVTLIIVALGVTHGDLGNWT
ncbi:60S ribosomal protein L18a-like protein [Cajanus cajan]|uniref:60S ribosomal protein L18a-like protein n=1 Tax=Cajanus cajan TaxID=3821 RepID=UPI00098DAF4D|nr:60S ribosomal protein L18a-like protein [Cajanus cajan]